MRARTFLAVVAVALALVASPAPAASPRVRVHLGLGWWYPWWWWGPSWAGEVVAFRGGEWTVVDTDVSPEHALVYLDGKLIGTADDFDGFPDYLYLRPPGRFELEFRLQGYETARLAIDAEENHFVPIDLKLKRQPGVRRGAWYDQATALPVARVFEKDRPAARNDQDAPARPAPRHGPARPDPTLRRELADSSAAQPDATTAVLILVVTPDSAAVYLNGQFLGTGKELSRLERGVAVPPGRHVVEALAPGFQARSLPVEVQEGARQQVVIELEAESGRGAGQNRTEVLY